MQKQRYSASTVWRAFFDFGAILLYPGDSTAEHYTRSISTMGQYRMFLYFFLFDFEPPTMQLISGFSNVSPGAATQAVDSFEKTGLIRRVKSGGLHQNVLLELTEKGIELRRTIREIHAERFRRYLALPEVEDTAVFHSVLVKLASFMKDNLPQIQKRWFGEELIRIDVTFPQEICPPYEELEDWRLLVRVFSHLYTSIQPVISTRTRPTLWKARVLLGLIMAKSSRIRYDAIQNRYPFPMTSLSQSVDCLISDGLLERGEQGQDKRTAEVLLTIDGKELKKRVLMYYEHVMWLFWSSIGTDLQQDFLDNISKRRKNLEHALAQVHSVHTGGKGGRRTNRKNKR